MTILILGAGGQLSTELMAANWPAGTRLANAGLPEIDLARPETLVPVLEAAAPELVINATAYTAVDKAESEPDLAFAINCDGPAWLAERCAARGVPLIHVSTDYVFDGTKATPYTEDDPVYPVSVYGASKEAGEARIRAAAPRHVIVRTAWVYAAFGNNFVKTMLRLGRERPEVRVVDDQHGNPTAAADLATALVAIASQVAGRDDAPWGTYHFAGSGDTTWYGFAERVFEHQQTVTGVRPHLVPITSADYPTPARRPANSRLDCSRLRARFGVTAPPWQDSLARVLNVLLPARAVIESI